jgi:hypothetical protein
LEPESTLSAERLSALSAFTRADSFGIWKLVSSCLIRPSTTSCAGNPGRFGRLPIDEAWAASSLKAFSPSLSILAGLDFLRSPVLLANDLSPDLNRDFSRPSLMRPMSAAIELCFIEPPPEDEEKDLADAPLARLPLSKLEPDPDFIPPLESFCPVTRLAFPLPELPLRPLLDVNGEFERTCNKSRRPRNIISEETNVRGPRAVQLSSF